MSNQDLKRYEKAAFLEAKEHIETIRFIIENLPLTLEENESLNEVYRATFCLRGFFAMFGYQNPIKGYGLDKCLQKLASKKDFFNDEIRELLLKLVDLMENYLNLLTENITPEITQNLLLESEKILAKLQVLLVIESLI